MSFVCKLIGISFTSSVDGKNSTKKLSVSSVLTSGSTVDVARILRRMAIS